MAKSITRLAWFFPLGISLICLVVPAPAQSLKSEQFNAAQGGILTNLPARYERWLSEDVLWIATPEERTAFLPLSTNEQRDRYIEQFWLRRDPTPGTPENEYKEEHYRRLAYANQHFAQAVPGWQTDRGRIYILYGPPRVIKVEAREGFGYASMRTELWHYDSVSGNGRDLDFKFVDVCGCGDYRLEPTGNFKNNSSEH